MPLAARIRRIALTIVVLPTPGPPVLINTLEVSASWIAATWLLARVRRICFSTHGKALSESIGRQGSGALASRISRSAIVRSARCRPARNTQGVSPTLSAITEPSRSSSSKRGPDQLLRHLEARLARPPRVLLRTMLPRGNQRGPRSIRRGTFQQPAGFRRALAAYRKGPFAELARCWRELSKRSFDSSEKHSRSSA